MIKCDRCGKDVSDAYYITRWFNGVEVYQMACKECIEKIGHDNVEEEDV